MSRGPTKPWWPPVAKTCRLSGSPPPRFRPSPRLRPDRRETRQDLTPPRRGPLVGLLSPPLLSAPCCRPNPTNFNLSLPFCGRWRYGPWGRSGHSPSAVAEIQRSEVQATSESKSQKRAPLPHCRRRRKESDQRFPGEQVFAAPKNEPETPYVVSYSGLRPRTNQRLLTSSPTVVCSRVRCPGRPRRPWRQRLLCRSTPGCPA